MNYTAMTDTVTIKIRNHEPGETTAQKQATFRVTTDVVERVIAALKSDFGDDLILVSIPPLHIELHVVVKVPPFSTTEAPHAP